MDQFITTFNGAVCSMLAIAAAWAALNPKVHDGVVIKAGLISMALGFAGTALALVDGLSCLDMPALSRSGLLIHGGLLLVAAGWLWRTQGGKHRKRRATDWGDFDRRPSFGPDR